MRQMIKAGHIIAFQNGEHRYLRDGVVVWEGNSILFVGKSFDGEVDNIIEAPDRLVTPGFINTHVHISESPLDKSFVEDVGKRHYYQSGLYEMLGPRNQVITRAHRASLLPYSMAELIRTGTTTLMEIGPLPDETVAEATKIGLRTYMATMYNSMAGWKRGPGLAINYEFVDEADRRCRQVDDQAPWQPRRPHSRLDVAADRRHVVGVHVAPHQGRCQGARLEHNAARLSVGV
jgi:5-methylthioadenosine/S-adenosylhomocysteine deaminase